MAVAAFSPDGALAATPVSNPAGIQLWETKYWRALRTIPLRDSGRDAMPLAMASEVEFSPDGRWLAAVGELPQRGKGEAVVFRLSDFVETETLPADALQSLKQSQNPRDL